MAAVHDGITDRRDASRIWTILCAVFLILANAIWLGAKLPQEILTYPDELLTAERAREMLIKGRDSVYFNFDHSFAKPPLQYWLTTLTLPHFANAATAVRIVPLVYGLLTAIAVGWTAFLVDPNRRWLPALSITIFLSCPLFSTETKRALLDTGLMFFTTLAIAFAELARRRPQWWIGVAIVSWLGALQKIPLIFLVWLIILAVRASSAPERARLRNGWLAAGIGLGVALSSIWPLIQYTKYGMPLARAFAGTPASTLFGEEQLGARSYFKVLVGLLATGWAGGGIAVLAALSFLFHRKRAPALVTEMSILSLTIVFLAVVFNFRSVRYVLPIVPALTVVLAFFLHQFAERNEKIRAGTIIFVIVFVLTGFAQAAIKMHHRPPDASAEKRVAEELGSRQTAAGTTILIKGTGARPALQSIGFYLFHGRLRFPIRGYSIARLAQSPLPRPVIGVCMARDFPAVRAVYPDAEAAFSHQQFICFRTGP